MALRTIVNAIKTLEESLSIASPIAVSIAAKNMRVYLISPKRGDKLTAKVTFMNWPDTAGEQRMGHDREDAFTVQIDCLVDDGNLETASDIALAMFDAAWAAFDEQRESSKRLGQSVDYLTLRSERPMIELIEWGGLSYPGFHLFLDLVAHEVSL